MGLVISLYPPDYCSNEIYNLKLYKKFDICKRVLIPKEAYYTMIEDLKTAAKPGGSKNRHEYYLLSK